MALEERYQTKPTLTHRLGVVLAALTLLAMPINCLCAGMIGGSHSLFDTFAHQVSAPAATKADHAHHHHGNHHASSTQTSQPTTMAATSERTSMPTVGVATAATGQVTAPNSHGGHTASVLIALLAAALVLTALWQRLTRLWAHATSPLAWLMAPERPPPRWASPC